MASPEPGISGCTKQHRDGLDETDRESLLVWTWIRLRGTSILWSSGANNVGCCVNCELAVGGRGPTHPQPTVLRQSL